MTTHFQRGANFIPAFHIENIETLVSSSLIKANMQNDVEDAVAKTHRDDN